MFAGSRRTAARKGLVEQLSVRDQLGFHPSPVGKRSAAGTADLIRQQLDDAIVLTIIVRFDDAIFIEVAKSNQSGVFDRRSQQLIEVRI
jgi:hypothetical protein